MKHIDLTSGNIYKQLVRFAEPVFLSSILTLLYNIVDTMIVGKCLGTSALAGVGATGTLMFLMTGLMNGFTVGSSIVTARFFGAKDEKGVIYVVASGHRLGHVCPFGKNYMFKRRNTVTTKTMSHIGHITRRTIHMVNSLLYGR